MESLHEQIAYGDHCVHGTAIGMPGGADLMCGLCESGRTLWISDELYTVYMACDEDPTPAFGVKVLSYRASELDDADLSSDGVQWWISLFEDSDLDVGRLRWQAFETSAGYWTTPEDDA